MPFAGTGTGKCRFLSIDGEITYPNIESTREELIKATKREASYIVNLAGVSACDLAGIQLLYSLFIQFEKDDRDFQIQESSPVVDEVLQFSGLSFPKPTCSISETGEIS